MTAAPTRSVPLYALYGEERAVEDREFVHVEEIVSRSRLYDWEIKPHTHAGLFQILVVAAGGVGVTLDGETRPVRGPAVITVPPGVVHGFHMTPDTAGTVISVAEAFLNARPGAAADLGADSILADVTAQPAVVDFSASPGRFRAVRRTAEALFAEFRWPQPGRAMMFDALLRGLIVLLRRKMAVPARQDGRRGYQRTVFTRYRTLIEEHFRDHWTVPAYAAAMGISESGLNRVCQAFTGKTAFAVVQDRLLLEAQRYLIYTAAPVSQVAYDLGFSDPGYFCRYFRKRTGETPQAFRTARGG